MPDDLFAASHALMGQKTVTQFWLDKMKEEWQTEAVAAERARIRAAVLTLPTLDLPTGVYVDVESVIEEIGA